MHKRLFAGVIIVALVSLVGVFLLNQHTVEAPQAEYIGPPAEQDNPATNTPPTPQEGATTQQPPNAASPKPTETFSGPLTEVNTGCFADGECYAVVDGKHITLTVGRRQEVVGTIVGAKSIADLESYIGQTATVYAKVQGDGTYTLYGNASYYLAVTPKVTKGCVVGGCSSQLCGEAGDDLVSDCSWTQKYSCYQTATCERQADGQCGWTETPALLQCIADADNNQTEVR